MKVLKILLPLFLLFLLSFCSSSERITENTYTGNLGTATDTDLNITVPRIMNRYSFVIYRQEDTMDGLYFESEWKERSPFDDEIALGVTEVRNRMLVTSRPRTAQASSLHRVSLEIENHTKIEGEEGWNRTLITDQANEYFSDIERVFRTELSTGVRRN